MDTCEFMIDTHGHLHISMLEEKKIVECTSVIIIMCKMGIRIAPWRKQNFCVFQGYCETTDDLFMRDSIKKGGVMQPVPVPSAFSSKHKTPTIL